jgi:hypothetical protein
MTQETAQAEKPAELELTDMERVIAVGDLNELTPQERFTYYTNVCISVGLNPYTQPFKYVKQNGELKLYATKDATDQLRRIYRVSISFEDPKTKGDVMYVRAHAKMPDGRSDEDIGAVSLANARGEGLANAMMKCHTKAKRRVTLSICGLGDTPDETELETMGKIEHVGFVEAQGAAPAALEPAVTQQPTAEPRLPYQVPPIEMPPPVSPPAPRGSDPQGPPPRPNPDVFHTAQEVKELIQSGAIQVDPPTAAKFGAPLPDGPPAGFAEEPAPPAPPAPEPPPQPSREDITLPEVMVGAMNVAKTLEELSVITKRVMGLKFEEHELVPIRAAYKANKTRLTS